MTRGPRIELGRLATLELGGRDPLRSHSSSVCECFTPSDWRMLGIDSHKESQMPSMSAMASRAHCEATWSFMDDRVRLKYASSNDMAPGPNRRSVLADDITPDPAPTLMLNVGAPLHDRSNNGTTRNGVYDWRRQSSWSLVGLYVCAACVLSLLVELRFAAEKPQLRLSLDAQLSRQRSKELKSSRASDVTRCCITSTVQMDPPEFVH
jgi:hypothetical protein